MVLAQCIVDHLGDRGRVTRAAIIGTASQIARIAAA